MSEKMLQLMKNCLKAFSIQTKIAEKSNVFFFESGGRRSGSVCCVQCALKFMRSLEKNI